MADNLNTQSVEAQIVKKVTRKKKATIDTFISDFQPVMNDLKTHLTPTIQNTDETAGNPFWQAVKNSPYFPTMIISLISSFFVSAIFYWAGKLLMKIKFEEMFQEKLPRYQSIVYSIGEIQNIDTDRLLLRDDLNEKHFGTDAIDGSIVLDMPKILDDNRLVQSLTDQRTLSPENMLSKADLDDDIFELEETTGHVTVDVPKIIEKNHLVQSSGDIQTLNVDNVLSKDDLSPSMLASYLGKMEDLSQIDEEFLEGRIIFDETAPQKYADILSCKAQFVPIKPLIIQVHDTCDVKILAKFVQRFKGNLVLDVSYYQLDLSIFEQLSIPIMRAIGMG